MVTINIPCTPIVKSWFNRNYPNGYTINTTGGIHKAIFALLCTNISNHSEKSLPLNSYTESLSIQVPDKYAFGYGARRLTPFTIVGVNQLIEDDLIKRDIRRDLVNARNRREAFKRNNHFKRSDSVNRETFKFINVIKDVLQEHGLSEETINIDTLKQISVRARKKAS